MIPPIWALPMNIAVAVLLRTLDGGGAFGVKDLLFPPLRETRD